MSQALLELAAFTLVFGVTRLALGPVNSRGRHTGDARDVRVRTIPQGYRLIHQYGPPVEVVLQYRGRAGYRGEQPVRILRSLRGADARLYLFGFSCSTETPEFYRVDRLVGLTAANGRALDMERFLTGELGIPGELCAAALGGECRAPEVSGHGVAEPA